MTVKTISGITALLVFTWLIWPKDPAVISDTNIAKFSSKESSRAEPRPKIKRELPEKVLKPMPRKKEKDPVIKRLDPNVELDHRLKTQQQVIADKGYGTFPPVDMKETNAHKEYLLKALQNPKENSGAISIIGKREKFNLADYQKDPSKYLNTIAPGRAFDAAAPAEGIKAIERVGTSSMRARQNETVTLSARGEAGMPVSFTAFDGGHFQNGLNSISLKADSSGIATVEFTATEGVINQARVRAASPVNTGTLQWTIRVSLKEEVLADKGEE